MQSEERIHQLVKAFMNRQINVVLVVLLSLYYVKSSGQKIPDKLPDITLTDTRLYYALVDYITVMNAPVIAVFMERSTNEYTYLFFNPTTYAFIADNPPAQWGRWKGKIVLFYTGIETITQMQDSTVYKHLLLTLQPVLTRYDTTLPDSLEPSTTAFINGRRVELVIAKAPILAHSETTWRLTIRDGKEISLEKDFDPISPETRNISIPYLNYKTRKRTSPTH